jgi:hypothetical protein
VKTEEVALSRPFRSDKRKKELLRLKKQEEKRLRRFGIKKNEDETVGEEGPQVSDINGAGPVPEVEKSEA